MRPGLLEALNFKSEPSLIFSISGQALFKFGRPSRLLSLQSVIYQENNYYPRQT